MEGKSGLKQLRPYQQGKQTKEIMEEYKLSRVVKLASNENPFGYSSKVKESFPKIARELEIYPDGYTGELRAKLAQKLNIRETQLIFGAGSDELVQIISRTFLHPGVNTVMATPTFPQYKHHATIEGATIKEIPTNEGYHDIEAMLDAIDADTRVVWLCTPDNPTGTVLSAEQITSFMNNCPDHVLVVLDEAYYEFMNPTKRNNMIEKLGVYKNLIILRTFSKAYGLAALRIGYGITNEAILKKLDIVRGPFNTSTISQRAAYVALDDDDFITETVTLNNKVKSDFQAFLDQIGWVYYESDTNFLLVKTPINGSEVFEFLLSHGFIIRPGELLGYPNTIRITIGNEEDMKELQSVILKLHEEQ